MILLFVILFVWNVCIVSCVFGLLIDWVVIVLIVLLILIFLLVVRFLL